MKLGIKTLSTMLFGLVLINGSVVAKEDVPQTIAGTTKIDAEQLIDLVDEHDDLVIIDSRKASDHAKGFIEGSIGMPDTATTPASLAEHLASKSTPVVFYCNGVKCARSSKAAKIAIEAGYSAIYWFRGGWAEWTSKGYPVSK